MMIQNRYNINRKIENPLYDIYEGHDIVQQCDIVLVKIDVKTNSRVRQLKQSSGEFHSAAKPNGLLTPYEIIEDNKGYFAVIILPKGTMLKKNIEMMNKIDKPFQESEIIRIGRLLCELTEKAISYNLKPIISSDLVFLAVDGAPSIIAIYPEISNETTASHTAISMLAIAMLLQDMTSAGRNTFSSGSARKVSTISPDLKKLLHLVSSESGHFNNLNDFAIALERQPVDRRYLKSFTYLCIIILILIASIVIFRLNNYYDLLNQDLAIEKIRLTTEKYQSEAHEAAKELAILKTSENVRSPQQTTNAQSLLLKGDEYIAALKFEEAQSAYKEAIILFKAATRQIQEIVKLRVESQKSRELARLSQSRWLPLLDSIHINIPEQINRAVETALEGEAQLMRGNYREAIVAYQMVQKLYEGIPSHEFNELLHRHQALSARQRARVAADSWEKIHGSSSLKTSKSASRAKEKMAVAESLIKTDQNEQATEVFNASTILFEKATKSAIENMTAKVATAHAYDNAMKASNEWQALFSSMKINAEPAEILEAKDSLRKAHQFAKQNEFKQSTKEYEHAASLFEYQTQQLISETEKLVLKAFDQVKQMFNSLTASQKKLENRLVQARKNFKKLQTKISQDHDTANHKQLMNEYADARKNYQLITKTVDQCNTNVYGGKANLKARSLITEAKALLSKGEYVQAHKNFKDATNKLTTLTELPNAIEKYFIAEENALESKESTIDAIGPIASQLHEVKKLTGLVETSLKNAKTLLGTGELAKATLALEDAQLALDSLMPQAEAELFNHALKADSELRKKVALASLEELLIINPENFRAQELLKKIQSNKKSTKRISIIDGIIRNNGKVIPFHPTKQTLIVALGRPSRVRTSHTGMIFDDLGIVATPDPTTNKIISIVVYYAQPLYKSEPKNYYSGTIEIEGIPIGRDDSIEKINKSLNHIEFKPTKIGNTFKTTQGNLRILVNYKQRTNQIYSIGMLFMAGRQS